MTTEEKAKAYDEAIERAKKFHTPDSNNSNLKAVLELIFPKLAESEDERIIEGFRKLLNAIRREGDVALNLVPIEKCEAWLEKQKENIEKEYVFRPLAGTDITIAAEQAIRRVMEGDHLVLAFNGAYIPVRKGCSANKIVDIYDAFIEKQKEQKPVEWSEADETYLQDALWCIEKAEKVAKDEGDMGACWSAERWLKSLPERFNLQPKQEWSKDDEHRLTDAIYFLESAKKHYADTSEIEKTIDWLKSLRPQSKQEWDKKDEEALKRAINCVRTWEIDYCDGDNRISERLKSFNGRFYLQPKNEWKHYIWAVNLRFDYDVLVRYEDNGAYEIVTAGNKPKRQVSGDYFLLKNTSYEESRKSWKPTEEQLETLKNVAYGSYQNGDGPILRELYDGLVKNHRTIPYERISKV